MDSQDSEATVSVFCDRTLGTLRCRKPYGHKDGGWNDERIQWHRWAIPGLHVVGIYDGGEVVASLSFDTWDDEIVERNAVELTARELLFGWRGAETFPVQTQSLGVIA